MEIVCWKNVKHLAKTECLRRGWSEFNARINVCNKYGKNPDRKFDAKVEKYEGQKQSARLSLILYCGYVFLVDIKMDKKFSIICKSSLVSYVFPLCQKNQPSSVGERLS